MRLPVNVVEVLNSMYQRYGFMMKGLDMDTKRDWCTMVAEQLNYQFPGDGWGV